MINNSAKIIKNDIIKHLFNLKNKKINKLF